MQGTGFDTLGESEIRPCLTAPEYLSLFLHLSFFFETYSMSMWDKKYKEKIKKGYKDVTELVSVEKEDNEEN